MVAINKQVYQISPRSRFTDGHGYLTGEAYRMLSAISEILNSVTIEDGEITAEKISVTNLEAISATLGNVVIDGDLVVNGTLTTPKYVPNSVSQPVASNGADITVTSGGGETEIHTEDITLDYAGDVTILFNSLAQSTNSNFPLTTYRLKRNGTPIVTKSWYVDDQEGSRDTILAFVDENPGTGDHTYSVTAQLNSPTAVAHTNVYMQLLNLKA